MRGEATEPSERSSARGGGGGVGGRASAPHAPAPVASYSRRVDGAVAGDGWEPQGLRAQREGKRELARPENPVKREEREL